MIKSRGTFWLVWEPSSGYTRARHATKQEAQVEAKRLAGEHKGQEFHVLLSIGCAVVRDPVDWVEFDIDRDEHIPF